MREVEEPLFNQNYLTFLLSFTKKCASLMRQTQKIYSSQAETNSFLKRIAFSLSHSSKMKNSATESTIRPIPKKLHGSYYRVMVNLPVIIKEKELVERKHTIDVFKKKTTSNQKQPPQGKSLQLKKTSDGQIGRIYINELWSEKFHKLVLKESKIQDVLDRISKLYRRNVSDFVDDLHQATETKQKTEEQMIQQHFHSNNTDVLLPRIQQPKQLNPNSNQFILTDTLPLDETDEILKDSHSQSLQQTAFYEHLSGSPSSQQIFSQTNNSSIEQPAMIQHLGGFDINTNNNSISDPFNLFQPSPSQPQFVSQNSKSFLNSTAHRKLSNLLPAVDSTHELEMDHSNLNPSPQKSIDSPLIHRKKYKPKKQDLSQPRHNALQDQINAHFFNSTQSIIRQCKSQNENWTRERSIAGQTIPFYINKDDRY